MRDDDAYRRGVIDGIRMAVWSPEKARRAAEWRLKSISILPDRFGAFVSFIGALTLLIGQPNKLVCFIGFILIVVGVAIRC